MNKPSLFVLSRKKIGDSSSIENFTKSLIDNCYDGLAEYQHLARQNKGISIFINIFSVLCLGFKEKVLIPGDIHYLAPFVRTKDLTLVIHDLVLLRRYSGIKRRLYEIFWVWLPIFSATRVVVVSTPVLDEVRSHYPEFRDKIFLACNILRQEATGDLSVGNQYGDGAHSDEDDQRSSKINFLIIGTTENKKIYKIAKLLSGIKAVAHVVGQMSGHDKLEFDRLNVEYSEYHAIEDSSLFSLYKSCDYLVCASDYEGFNLTILEANHFRLPLLLSDIAVHHEVAGETAIFVNYDDSVSLTQLKGRLVKRIDTAGSYGAKCQKNLERFSPAIQRCRWAKAMAYEANTDHRDLVVLIVTLYIFLSFMAVNLEYFLKSFNSLVALWP